MFQHRQEIHKASYVVLSLLFIVDLSFSSQCDCGVSRPKFVHEIGETLNITCTCDYLRQFANIPSVFIKKPNGSQQTMYHVTGSTNFTFEMEITSCSQGGTYICMTDQCNRRTLRNSFDIRVEDTNMNPKLECIYNRHFDVQSNLTCTWMANCVNNRYKWILFYKKQSSAKDQVCQSISNLSCVIQAPHVLQYENYTLRLVQMEYQRENKTFEYRLYTDESVWRLAVKVYRVIVLGPDKLNITLHISDSVRTLICRVNYTSKWELHLNQVNFTSSFLSDLEVIIPVEHLEPYTLYNLSVDCRSSWSPFWSTPTRYILVKTQPAAPDQIPSNILFADEILTSNKMRQIYLYWVPLSNRNLHGNNTQYSVTFSNETNHNCTETFRSDTTTAALKHQFPPDKEIMLLIGSQNEAGTGTIYKTIRIPSHTPARFQPVLVNGQDSSNISLFWEGQAEQEGRYIYYWCQGTSVSGHIPLCQTELFSKSDNNTTVTIKTNSTGNRKWYFGASVQRNGNVTYLGQIVFSKCTFTDTIQDEIHLLQISAFRVNNTTITLSLPEYCNFQNIPSVYQVATFTEKLNCSIVQTYTNFSAAPRLKTLNIEWTDEKTVYICVRVVFHSGFASESQLLVIDSIDQDELHHSEAIVVGTLVAIGILLALASIILIRRYLEKLKNSAKIEDIVIYPSNPPDTTDLESLTGTMITAVDNNLVHNAIKVSSGYVDIETEMQSASDHRVICTNDDNIIADTERSDILLSGKNRVEHCSIDSENIFTRDNALIEDLAIVDEAPEGKRFTADTSALVDIFICSDEATHADTIDTSETSTADNFHANRIVTQSGTDSNDSLVLPRASGNNSDTTSLDTSSSNSSERSDSAINSYVQSLDISYDSSTLSTVNADQSDYSYVLATHSRSVMHVSDMVCNQVEHRSISRAVSVNDVTGTIGTISAADFSSDSAISESTNCGSISSYITGV